MIEKKEGAKGADKVAERTESQEEGRTGGSGEAGLESSRLVLTLIYYFVNYIYSTSI